MSLLGFGTFSTASREARTARVPGTDKTVNVPATTVAKFKVGKALKVHISELPDSDAGVVPDTFAMRFSRV